MSTPDPTLFADDAGLEKQDRQLVDAYAQAGRTLDDLPYTLQFDTIHAVGAGGRTKHELFHKLHNIRKAGKLPRLGRAESNPPRIEPEEEAILIDLVKQAVGTLGQRDQLPYSPAFDELVEKFNAQTGRNLHPHDIWRITAKLAK